MQSLKDKINQPTPVVAVKPTKAKKSEPEESSLPTSETANN